MGDGQDVECASPAARRSPCSEQVSASRLTSECTGSRSAGSWALCALQGLGRGWHPGKLVVLRADAHAPDTGTREEGGLSAHRGADGSTCVSDATVGVVRALPQLLPHGVRETLPPKLCRRLTGGEGHAGSGAGLSTLRTVPPMMAGGVRSAGGLDIPREEAGLRALAIHCRPQNHSVTFQPPAPAMSPALACHCPPRLACFAQGGGGCHTPTSSMPGAPVCPVPWLQACFVSEVRGMAEAGPLSRCVDQPQ